MDAAIARELLRAPVEPMAIEAALEAERRHMELQRRATTIVELEPRLASSSQRTLNRVKKPLPVNTPLVFTEPVPSRSSLSLPPDCWSTTAKESPQMAGLAAGGGNTMFIEVEQIDAVHDRVAPRAQVVMPIVTQWYGMREFALTDPDGYVITFAERVAAR